ncbi:hypothetical protein AB0395_35185 [Streptosporangium sp. NPDC051023]|uniref:hypothetical protein n=1 Tax=Streptosporangium sp. NPDC051023 TaxID=3155410 RepID=UPI00344F7F37
MDTTSRRAVLEALIDSEPVRLEDLLAELRRIWGHRPGVTEQKMSAALRELGQTDVELPWARRIAQWGVIQISAVDTALLDLWEEITHWARQVADPYAGGELFADDGDDHYSTMDLDLWQEECERHLNDALTAAAHYALPASANAA